jgi:acetyltransferase-like isoleucine patch superfamily enzyme
MIKKLILHYLGDFIAKTYISLVKPSLNNYNIKSQFKNSIVGKNTQIFGSGTLFNGENLKIGNYSRIGENFFLHAQGKITIGNNTIISRNVTIYSATHNFKSQFVYPYDKDYILKPVVIGNSVWIGMNVCILPGVTIGDGAIIAMGSIITKDVNSGDIVGSSSQRILGNRPIIDINNYNNIKHFYELNFK